MLIKEIKRAIETRQSVRNAHVFNTCRTLKALDAYGLKLADEGHTWTPRERRVFERAVRRLKKA